MHVGAVMTVRVAGVEPGATVREAITRMTEEGVGAVAVCEGTRLVGIFTERDVLRLAAEQGDFRDHKVADVMTRRPVTTTPDVLIVDAARLMGERRIRHLPVVERDDLLGMLGIRDVLMTLVERVWSEHDAGARETARGLLRRGN